MRICLVMSVVLLSLRLTAQNIALRPFEAEGFAALNRADYERCAQIFSSASRVHRAEPSPPFVAARCYAKANDKASAYRHLADALRRGYRNCPNIARDEVLAAFGDLLLRCETNAEEFVRRSNPELLAAYLADRSERSSEITDIDAAKKRDTARRELVRIAVEHRTLRTADDYLHAALVMQHGSMSSDFALARDLAKRATDLRPWLAEARWLYAAATDRYLHATGKPQVFGTQYRLVNGLWTLEPFDTQAVTDDERSLWRVQTLEERRRFIDELNSALKQ